jgi:hypothetical protein
VEAARERAVRKTADLPLSQGPDLQLMHDLILMTRYRIEGGIRKFPDYALQMAGDFGESVRPYLAGLYENFRRWPGLEHVAAEMSPPEEVDRYLAGSAAVPATLQHEGTSPSCNPDSIEGPSGQVRQLIKQALESPTPEGLEQFLQFATKFRRLAVWNTRMAYIQRPGARMIASEYEWSRVGRKVLPDAVPIIILWPFGPIRFVYEFADREALEDPFAVRGEFSGGALSTLETSLKKQKRFKINIELRRQGFRYAGSAASQMPLPLPASTALSPSNDRPLGEFAHENSTKISESQEKVTVPSFRITLNDRLEPKERFVTLAHELGHIFCGHLGGCTAPGRDQDESGWPDRRILGQHEREIEAEAVAYVVAARAGLITRSAEYLKVHAQKGEMNDINVDLVVRAVARIERLAKIHYGNMMFRE